jgi:hypothetical protein
MANHATAQVSFTFTYDGLTQSIAVDTQKGPVFYQNIGNLHPLFSTDAASAINVVISNQIVTLIAVPPIATTATMSASTLTVVIPSGLSAGTYIVSATLRY